MDTGEFTLNEEKNRFELPVEEDTAYIEYILTKDNIIFLTHTEVPQALEGKGIGKKIVGQTLDYIKQKDYTLAPLCPFVASYIKRNPEWKSILAKGYNVG